MRTRWRGRIRGRALAGAVLLCSALLMPAGARGALLTPAPGSPLALGQFLAASTLSPNGDLLAVSMESYDLKTLSIGMYKIAADGSATPVPGSPLTTTSAGLGWYLAFSPDGKLLATANTDNNLLGMYAVAADGALTKAPGEPFDGGFHPSSVAWSPNGKQLAMADYASQVSMDTVAANGVVTPVGGSPFRVGIAPGAATFSPNGAFLAVTDQAPGSVEMRVVSPAGDISTAVPGSPFDTATSKLVPAFSPDGALLATADGNSGTVSMFSVAANGALTQVPGSPVSGNARALAWSQTGKLLVTTDPNINAFTVYSVGAGGAPHQVLGSPFSIGSTLLSPSFGRSGTLLAIGDVGLSGDVYLFKVGKPDQAITFPAVGSHAFGSAPVALGATSTSALPVTYSALSGPCTISGTKMTLTGAGSCVVAADQAGSADYDAAPRITQTITITKSAQTIAFPDAGAHAYGDAPVALAATATSGLPVAYSVTGGPCTVSGKNLMLIGSGSCVVAADQAGGADYDAAPRVTRTVAVAKGAQAIDFPDPGPHVLGDAPVALGATASSDLPVTYSVANGPCTVSGATLTLTGVGTCVVAAGQPGDQDHAVAATVTRSVAITAPPAAPGEPAAPSSPSVFTPLTTPPAVAGTSSPSAPATPISAGAATPCAGLTAGPLLRCRALATYKAALAKCTKISTRSRAGARRRSACVAKAKLAYHRALARAKCQSTKNARSRATCVAKARKIKK